MEDTKIFTPEKVSKFFGILRRLKRSTCDWYKGYDEEHHDYAFCQQEIFIKRTIYKWFSRKYITLYNEQYKRFIFIIYIEYKLGYSQDIGVYYIDAAQPEIKNMKIDHNEAIQLEGKWDKASSDYKKIINMVSLKSLPNKVFTFKAYDWDKYPKRIKKGTDPKNKIETTIDIVAKTHQEAYARRKEIEKESKDGFMIGELIKIKNK